MNPTELTIFIWGCLATASVTVTLFFLRFWQLSRERLFLFFALAFLALGTNWVGLALINPPVESRHYLYLLRLTAFLLIIVGIVDKNRRRART
jgi:hypothetical protein